MTLNVHVVNKFFILRKALSVNHFNKAQHQLLHLYMCMYAILTMCFHYTLKLVSTKQILQSHPQHSQYSYVIGNPKMYCYTV